jgi:hypothetical protein
MSNADTEIAFSKIWTDHEFLLNRALFNNIIYKNITETFEEVMKTL